MNILLIVSDCNRLVQIAPKRQYFLIHCDYLILKIIFHLLFLCDLMCNGKAFVVPSNLWSYSFQGRGGNRLVCWKLIFIKLMVNGNT